MALCLTASKIPRSILSNFIFSSEKGGRVENFLSVNHKERIGVILCSGDRTSELQFQRELPTFFLRKFFTSAHINISLISILFYRIEDLSTYLPQK